NETYSFYVGKDEIAPVIVADTPTAFAESQLRYYFRCAVTDNSQRVGPVRAEYRVGGGPLQGVELTARSGDIYEGSLDLGALTPGQEVTYRLFATDQAQDPNTVVFPAAGERRVSVRRGRWIDFESAPSDFDLRGFWEIGAPDDRDLAYSGHSVLATGLNDLYPDAQSSTVIWGPVDLTDFTRP